jgi:hypothetical protein
MSPLVRYALSLITTATFFPFSVGAQSEIVDTQTTFTVQAATASIPQSIAFQGYLEDNGSPAEGTYDFQVALYESLEGGSSLVSETISDHPVANGSFNLTLSFGAEYFWEEARFLELRVRDGASGGAYDIIAPRSAVVGAPIALALPNVFADPSLPFVGVGRSNQISSSEAFGVYSPVSSTGQFGGMYISTEGPSTRPFYGYANGGSITAYHYLDGNTDKWHLYNSGAVRLTVQSDGDVGIGTGTPEERLHVEGSDADILVGSSSAQHVLVEGESSIGSAVRLYSSDGSQTIALASEEASGQGSSVSLYNANGTRTIELDADFGSGSGNPGRVITDELELNGSDLAEHFDVAGDLSATSPKPGMVVSIDTLRPGRLVVSDSPYDRKVIGIISGAGDIRPGIYMGQEGTLANGEHPVAVAGRVYVLADAGYGTIRAGDMLTSSDTPGHAMVASDTGRSRGAVIGKAMTPLHSGTGLVLVFVSLQ